MIRQIKFRIQSDGLFRLRLDQARIIHLRLIVQVGEILGVADGDAHMRPGALRVVRRRLLSASQRLRRQRLLLRLRFRPVHQVHIRFGHFHLDLRVGGKKFLRLKINLQRRPALMLLVQCVSLREEIGRRQILRPGRRAQAQQGTKGQPRAAECAHGRAKPGHNSDHAAESTRLIFIWPMKKRFAVAPIYRGGRKIEHKEIAAKRRKKRRSSCVFARFAPFCGYSFGRACGLCYGLLSIMWPLSFSICFDRSRQTR